MCFYKSHQVSTLVLSNQTKLNQDQLEALRMDSTAILSHASLPGQDHTQEDHGYDQVKPAELRPRQQSQPETTFSPSGHQRILEVLTPDKTKEKLKRESLEEANQPEKYDNVVVDRPQVDGANAWDDMPTALIKVQGVVDRLKLQIKGEMSLFILQQPVLE